MFWFPSANKIATFTTALTCLYDSKSWSLSHAIQLASDALLPHWVPSSGDFIVGRGTAGRAPFLLKAGVHIVLCWLTFYQALRWASVSVSFALYTVELPQQDQCQAESCVFVISVKGNYGMHTMIESLHCALHVCLSNFFSWWLVHSWMSRKMNLAPIVGRMFAQLDSTEWSNWWDLGR